MSDKELKDFVDNYQDANGDNPMEAALSLWGIAKLLPLNILKAALLALFFLVASWVLTFLLPVPFPYSMITTFGASAGALLLGVFALLKFLCDHAISAVAEIATGILSPVDDMYDVFQDKENAGLSRVQFSQKVVQEVLVPRLAKALPFLPMRKGISKSIGIFANQLAHPGSKGKATITQEDIQRNSIKTMMVKVNRASRASRRVMSRPFWFFVSVFVVVWVAAIILALMGV